MAYLNHKNGSNGHGADSNREVNHVKVSSNRPYHNKYPASLPYRMYACSPWPLVLASVGYAVTLMSMGVSNAIANIRRPRNYIVNGTLIPVEPLSDLVLPFIPHLHTNDFANTLVYGCITFTSWTVILHPRRRHLCRRLLIMWAIIYLMRATTIVVTSLPDPNDMCRNGEIPNTVETFFSGLSCGDMIFSGHTVALILGPLMMHQAFPRMPQWVAIGMWFYACTGMFALLATHMHYTVDILVAVYISFLTFIGYHATVSNEEWLARYEWLAWWEHDRFYSCTWLQYWQWIQYKWRGDPKEVDPRLGEDPSFDSLLPISLIHPTAKHGSTSPDSSPVTNGRSKDE